jgi:hypothetical protein
MTTDMKIGAVLAILVTTLACAFVQDLIFPPTSTPQVLPSPRDVPASTPEPVDYPEPIDCRDDECLNACLDRLDEVLESSSPDPIGNSIYEAQGANFNLVIYPIEGEEIGKPTVLYVPSEYHKYQEDTASHMRIWKFYAAIIPPELRQYVNEFIIYTDGVGSSFAWVRPSLRDDGFWQVGFDLLDSDYPLYLADSLVHETAHVLTLNSSQVPAEEDKYYYYDEKEGIFRGCEQFAVAGGCSLPDSYINLFYQRFWENSYAEWWAVEQEAQNAVTSDEYYKVLAGFYDQHEDWFINTYAASDLAEDMAESFSFFILNPKPTGETIYDQKVAFYYEFPELVEYRRQIIAGLCSYVK